MPSDDERSPDTGQWQGGRSRLDRFECGPWEAAPALDGHLVVRTPPRSNDLAVGQNCAGPDTEVHNARR